ncbi:MAG: phosphopantetheine-binding protein [Ignavibacteria bacterium]|nr:hypothetical protein [Ignavibacteriota bacterium]
MDTQVNNQIKNNDIGIKLVSIISDALRIAKENILPDTRIITDLNAESLDVLDIRFSIEQEFGFKIGEHEIFDAIGDGMSPAEFSELFTVSYLTEFVDKKIQSLTADQ